MSSGTPEGPGTHPGGGKSPYGAYDPYDSGPYPYGSHGQAYGYAAGPHLDVEGVRTHAIVALVVSITLALSCFVSLGGIAGAVLSGIALGKVETETPRARGLIRWAWIGIGVNLGLIALATVVFLVAGLSNAFGS
ncbi:hypothetical protein [Planomonospora venezuelensis]|uniref:DUF4190 domain-containing protein n=1 Tax=Planomonospora venezuelensis TaxID=1999 RepID=A0A841D9W1_PLAVE|nr:hypothetical protein [Planomonospora venezuelensis]MBB5965264.1 hypothetical protein [Planomonospora venezuelensis]GIN00502.1 hypothetical protein Pve01_21600 [Planomonospora venezuelensis]